MTDDNAPKPYEVAVPIAAGRDVVWDFVTQPPLIAQWFGWDYDGITAEIQQIFVDEATLISPERMGWADGTFLEVTGDDDRSTVRVVRGEPPAPRPEAYDPIEEGWKAFLVQLRQLAEPPVKGARRTVYLTGDSTGKQALGLIDGEPARMGSRMAWAVTPDGQLVVVLGRRPLDDPAAGRVEIIVSTYGADDVAFSSCHTTWSESWAPVARGATVTVREGS